MVRPLLRPSRLYALSLVICAIAVPLGLTFYAWRISSNHAQDEARAQFSKIIGDIEKKLNHAADTHSNVLRGAAAFFQASEFVSSDEWRSYVETIDIRHNFAGITDIGIILSADSTKEAMPASPYIINTGGNDQTRDAAILIDPTTDITQQKAAHRARQTGQASMTGKIAHAYNPNGSQHSFLVFYPIYAKGKPTRNAQERDHHFRGWIYARFTAHDFFLGLLHGQHDNIHLEAYDGETHDPAKLIYNDDAKEHYTKHDKSHHRVVQTVPVMGRTWTLVWRSTEHYDNRHISHTPILILTGGLIFTALFALFLVVVAVRSTDMLERIAGDRVMALPMVVFVVTAGAAVGLHIKLEQREISAIHSSILDRAQNIESVINAQTADKITAIKRMAQRWQVAGGTPENQWRDDAQNYIGQISGLRTVAHINTQAQVTLREPKNDDTAMAVPAGSFAYKNPVLIGAVILAADKKPVLPVYVATYKNGAHDGFIAGFFETYDFFGAMVDHYIRGKYAIIIHDGHTVLYRDTDYRGDILWSWATERTMRFADKLLRLRIIPVQSFVTSQKTALPFIVLVFGLMIGALLSMTVRFILISRIRSDYLKSSEDTFRSAMDNAPIGMALLDKNGRWIAVNKALCAMVGYADADLLQAGAAHITPDSDDSMERDMIGQLLLGTRDAYQLEKRMIHRDGHILWALQSVSMARNSDGTVKYFVQQFEDITERKKMDQMKAEFISVISHELRTPLTSIRGSLGLIEGAFAKDLPDRVLSLVSLAHKNCERLILLINDILDLDKIAAGKMRFDMRIENLAKLVTAGVEANSAYAARFNVTFDVGAVPSEIHVRVDANRWHQVFSNLLSNAAKFSPEGGRVAVTCRVMGQTVRIAVRDKGAGISPEFRSRIFEKFTQADSTITRQKGGTGLGLHISKQIIERMNGRIGFDSVMGGGTTFWFDMPVVRDMAADNQNGHMHENTLPRILHIEDDRDLSAVLHSALADRANLVTATTLRAAEDALTADTYAMVVLDIAMPDGSGLAFLERIRALAGHNVPVIILSAHDMGHSVENDVAAVLIKSRVPETYIVDTILAHLPADAGERVA